MVWGLVLCSYVDKSKVKDDDIIMLCNPLVINVHQVVIYMYIHVHGAF